MTVGQGYTLPNPLYPELELYFLSSTPDPSSSILVHLSTFALSQIQTSFLADLSQKIGIQTRKATRTPSKL